MIHGYNRLNACMWHVCVSSCVCVCVNVCVYMYVCVFERICQKNKVGVSWVSLVHIIF
jgi:hypothetical protein